MWRGRDYYYVASPRGDSYVGWQLSIENESKAPRLYPAERYRLRYENWDKVKRTLFGLSKEEAEGSF